MTLLVQFVDDFDNKGLNWWMKTENEERMRYMDIWKSESWDGKPFKDQKPFSPTYSLQEKCFN